MNFEKGVLNYFSVPLNSNQKKKKKKISLTQKTDRKTPNTKRKKKKKPKHQCDLCNIKWKQTDYVETLKQSSEQPPNARARCPK